MRLHHLGVATEDADGTARKLSRLLDVPLCHEERLDGLEIRFLELPAGYIELLEPIANGPVSRFLERRGPGIHHVAFEAFDIAARLAHAEDLGIERIDDAPRPGAWGHEVAFLHPQSTGGILIEFVST